MIKLSALPDFFPVLLLPIYWIFWLAFYLFYLPVYFFIWLFNPFRSKKTALAYYSRKAKRDKRLVEYFQERSPPGWMGAPVRMPHPTIWRTEP